MSWFSRLIERRIRKVEVEGKLSNLDDEGQPVPDRLGDALVDPGIAAGYRIIAEAGVLPEEFEPKKQIDGQRERHAELTDEGERKDAMAELARLETRLGIAIDARKKFHQG